MNIPRSLLRALALMCLIVLAVNPAIAKPIFIAMDASKPGDTPHDFGYEITARRSGDGVAFTIDLDARASKAFESAKVIFATSTPVRVTTTKDGLKHLAFTVPVAHLAHSMLEIQSDLLRDKDAKLTEYDFHGYRLLLDSIPLTKEPQAGDPKKLPGELKQWMDAYAKNPTLELNDKIHGTVGENVSVSGYFKSEGDLMVLCVGSEDWKGGVDYIFHYDPAKPRETGLAVYGDCEGTITYVDSAKKIVVLDHIALEWRGSD